MNFYRFDLKTLQRWLQYDLPGGILFFISFLFIASLYVLAIFVLLFLPLLIGTLIKEKRYGWLASLFLLVILPAILIFTLFHSSSWFMILQFIPIATFLLYCFVLKLSIPRWKDPIVEPEPTPDLEL